MTEDRRAGKGEVTGAIAGIGVEMRKALLFCRGAFFLVTLAAKTGLPLQDRTARATFLLPRDKSRLAALIEF
jgi:hypothetical protein